MPNPSTSQKIFVSDADILKLQAIIIDHPKHIQNMTITKSLFDILDPKTIHGSVAETETSRLNNLHHAAVALAIAETLNENTSTSEKEAALIKLYDATIKKMNEADPTLKINNISALTNNKILPLTNNAILNQLLAMPPRDLSRYGVENLKPGEAQPLADAIAHLLEKKENIELARTGLLKDIHQSAMELAVRSMPREEKKPTESKSTKNERRQEFSSIDHAKTFLYDLILNEKDTPENTESAITYIENNAFPKEAKNIKQELDTLRADIKNQNKPLSQTRRLGDKRSSSPSPAFRGDGLFDLSSLMEGWDLTSEDRAIGDQAIEDQTTKALLEPNYFSLKRPRQ